jgi:hypothetical protein
LLNRFSEKPIAIPMPIPMPIYPGWGKAKISIGLRLLQPALQATDFFPQFLFSRVYRKKIKRQDKPDSQVRGK